MQTASIRFAERADLEQVLLLLRAKAEFDGSVDFFKAKPEEIENAFFGDSPKAFALVAELDNELVGIATYFETFSTFLAKTCIWLDDLFIQTEQRSKGIGKRILARLSEIAKEKGAGRIEWTVAVRNFRGQDFYKKIGADIRKSVHLARLDSNGIENLSNY